ncbi:YceI family protein [Tenacibaculum aquimarinum]|uniref:YceI family protein n=1 Tax=Tenacibaculum aquimarinum TaxID=2910675 RepID=UPI001F0AF690|nr:YceI family protein [Tenacibaculum aquimarinum]MCH3884249.1 YceI family protein [Tenacibaculum aquimarinum]
MKKVILSLVVIASVLTACKGEKKEEVAVTEEVKVEVQELKNNLDVEASVLTWKGNKPTGSHDGVVSLKEGNLTVVNGVLTSGEFVIDMNSITNLDMKGSDGAGKLEGHLKNADFFDVEKYPTSKFVITSVAKGENALNVTGNLTIKDVTKSITIPATVSENEGAVTFKSEKFKINRADFNIKYGSKSFFDNLKDKFIDDLMEMSFEVKTKA